MIVMLPKVFDISCAIADHRLKNGQSISTKERSNGGDFQEKGTKMVSSDGWPLISFFSFLIFCIKPIDAFESFRPYLIGPIKRESAFTVIRVCAIDIEGVATVVGSQGCAIQDAGISFARAFTAERQGE
jgi:hypothetical protein